MRSTHNITTYFLKKYGKKIEKESDYIPYGKKYIHEIHLRSQTLIDTSPTEFANDAELEKHVERRALESFHNMIFSGKSGVIIYPEDIMEFRYNVEKMAEKTGSIFAVMEVVDAFCTKLAMTK